MRMGRCAWPCEMPRSRHYLGQWHADEHDLTLDPSAAARAAAPFDRASVADDKAMLRAAAELTRDLNAPRPAIYWADLIASAVLGYAALAAAVLLRRLGWRWPRVRSRCWRSTAR